MSSPQDNVAKLREAYRIWHETRGGSADRWISMMDDDVLLRSPGEEASGVNFSGGLRGKAHAEQYFSGLAREWEMIHYTVDDLVAEGDRVVMIGRCAFRSKRTGKVVESPKVDIYRFRDGRIAEYQELFDTARVVGALTPD